MEASSGRRLAGPDSGQDWAGTSDQGRARGWRVAQGGRGGRGGARWLAGWIGDAERKKTKKNASLSFSIHALLLDPASPRTRACCLLWALPTPSSSAQEQRSSLAGAASPARRAPLRRAALILRERLPPRRTPPRRPRLSTLPAPPLPFPERHLTPCCTPARAPPRAPSPRRAASSCSASPPPAAPGRRRLFPSPTSASLFPCSPLLRPPRRSASPARSPPASSAAQRPCASSPSPLLAVSEPSSAQAQDSPQAQDSQTEESLSRSHERLLRRDDYIDYVCDYLVYVDYFFYITTPHVSKSAIPMTTTTLVFFFQDSCSIPGN
ncbi:hypothetical protein BRADI_5g04681v3 [Brachypodium distachyon]|uniref:Uncharacterized protein n=1 Tax=Brachypodium distachyon TaxID=15368 RepID=A0A0Q3I7F2_BRADI|nr:hypothetical protein BRADI_5g04681v3 [Brachypodium distachyon]